MVRRSVSQSARLSGIQLVSTVLVIRPQLVCGPRNFGTRLVVWMSLIGRRTCLITQIKKPSNNAASTLFSATINNSDVGVVSMMDIRFGWIAISPRWEDVYEFYHRSMAYHHDVGKKVYRLALPDMPSIPEVELPDVDIPEIDLRHQKR